MELDKQLNKRVSERKCCEKYTLGNERTFSFFSVSSLSEADRDSRVSPCGVDEAPLGLIIDCLRAGELREEETRGEAAERAVAPLAIEEEGGGVELGGVRREAGVALADAVVAMMGYRQEVVCCARRMKTGSLPPLCRKQ